jgi:hypothetical protein
MNWRWELATAIHVDAALRGGELGSIAGTRHCAPISVVG